MKHVDRTEWEQLKQHAARHLTDPAWLGGGHGIDPGVRDPREADDAADEAPTSGPPADRH